MKNQLYFGQKFQKKAFTEGKVKPNNYVEFGGDEKMVENSFCKKECLYF